MTGEKTEQQKSKIIEKLRGDQLVTMSRSHNDIFRWRSPGQDGIWYRYLVQQRDTGGGVVVLMEHGTGLGMTDADLLEIVRDRLRCRAREQDDEALWHVEAAIGLLSREAKRA